VSSSPSTFAPPPKNHFWVKARPTPCIHNALMSVNQSPRNHGLAALEAFCCPMQRSFHGQSAGADILCPHTGCYLTLSGQFPLTNPVIPHVVHAGSSRRPPGIWRSTNTVKGRLRVTCGRMIPRHQPSTLREWPFDYTARCAPSMYCSQGLRSTLHCARPASYVELHITGEMLRTQKC
jgi:hypothetical protein